MPVQRVQEALFSEFLARLVERFDDAVGIERERVARRELTFGNGTIPFFEEAEHGTRGIEPFQRSVAAQVKAREVPAIGVAQQPGLVVIFGKEEGGVGARNRIFEKELVDGLQKT